MSRAKKSRNATGRRIAGRVFSIGLQLFESIPAIGPVKSLRFEREPKEFRAELPSPPCFNNVGLYRMP
jgi:hypothetical protein